MERETILVTGATGTIGYEVVRALLRDPLPPRLFLLLRGEPSQISRKVDRMLSWAGAGGRGADVVALLGEARAPGLGMSAENQRRVRSEVTCILHLAASTRFDQSRESSDLNVTSTRHVIEIARRCKRLDRIGLASTASVAGRRSGVIREDDLLFDCGFFNEYERSKALAERLGRLAMETLPIAIYRLSLVVGRRSDGRVSRPDLFAAACRLLRHRLLPDWHADPAQLVDMIPVDFAAESLIGLLRRAFVPGATYHVCAGDRSLSLQDIRVAIADGIERAESKPKHHGSQRIFGNDHGDRSDTMAARGSQRTPHGAVRPASLANSSRLQTLARQMGWCTRQLEKPKSYDTTLFDAQALHLGLTLAHAREWLPMVVDCALDSTRSGPSAGQQDDNAHSGTGDAGDAEGGTPWCS